jgi:hypothetical protein
MHLDVDPADLAAAAQVLQGCARRLADDTDVFAGVAARETPEVGEGAQGPVAGTNRKAVDAAQAVTADLRRLAEALADLARLYPAVDAAALGARVSR